MTQATQAKPRNRSATEARILEAARLVIARDGLTAFGVNAVAAEAGCDKKLITRYFGSIDGVLRAVAGDIGFWVADAAPHGPHETYADFILALAVGYQKLLNNNPILRRVLAWELVERSETLRQMEDARSKALMAWIAEARGDLKPPPGVDAPVLIAMLTGAMRYLTLAKATLGQSAGVDLTKPENEARLNAAFARLIRLAFSEDPVKPNSG